MPDGLAPNPNPDPTAPPAGVVAPMAPNAPITPGGVTLPPPPAAMAPAPPPPPTPSPAAVAQNAKHNVMGQVAQALLGGGHTTYQVDPNTNQVVPVQQPNKPGNLWRQIVGGVIMGGMAGAETPVGHSPLEAAFRGAGAAQAYGQQQDREAFARANEQSKTQIESKKLDLEQQRVQAEIKYQEAMIAHQTQANLLAQANFDFMTHKYFDELNDRNEQLSTEMAAAGGRKIDIEYQGRDINGLEGNHADKMAAIVQDPSILRNPTGKDGQAIAYRIHTHSVNLDGLHQEVGKGWVDNDGKQVDLAHRTTDTIWEVPVDFTKRRVNLTNAQMAALPGVPKGMFPDNNDQANATNEQLMSLSARGQEIADRKAQMRIEGGRLAVEMRRLDADLADRKDRKEEEQTKLTLTAAQDNLKLLGEYTKDLEQSRPPTTDKEGTAAFNAEMQAYDALKSESLKTIHNFMTTGKTGESPQTGGGSTVASPTVMIGSTKVSAPVAEIFQKAKPANWDQIGGHTDLDNAQKIELAAVSGVRIPFSEIQKMAAATKQNPEDLARMAEAFKPGIVDRVATRPSAEPPDYSMAAHPEYYRPGGKYYNNPPPEAAPDVIHIPLGEGPPPKKGTGEY